MSDKFGLKPEEKSELDLLKKTALIHSASFNACKALFNGTLLKIISDRGFAGKVPVNPDVYTDTGVVEVDSLENLKNPPKIDVPKKK